MSARRVRSRKRRIVAANLGTHLIGVAEKVEIVDGHHLGGVRRGNQQRTLAVHYIMHSREPFDRRPFQAIPPPDERPHRNSDVDDANRRHFGCQR
jgi:hypothetical protein